MFVTENQLDEWVRGNARDAQGVIVELVWRLVAASVPGPKERRFPLGDSIGQHGPDGLLVAELPFPPFVPEGRSYWEIGTGQRAREKVTSDYADLVDSVPEEVREESTFVFVTPLSGRRDWEYTFKPEAQADWVNERKRRGDWKDVRIFDGTGLIDWLHSFPPVALWLANRTLRTPIDQLESVEDRWAILKEIGNPPPLPFDLFLANREEAVRSFQEILGDRTVQLKLETRFPDQVVDFLSACIAGMDQEERAEASGRCIIVSGLEAWRTMASQRNKLVLIADSGLDLAGNLGTKLIQEARRGGHAVVFGGTPGGVPDPGSVPLASPGSGQIRDALQKAGHPEERARTLSQKSGGNLGSLLRCLQNLSLMPEWAETSAAANLAIAAVLGSWTDGNANDQEVAAEIAGKGYGEWIQVMRESALRRDTPLSHRDGSWRFVPRFEGWYALGPKLYDEHLDRFGTAVVRILGEEDPQFDLSEEQRFAAAIHGKSLSHSSRLRSGFAETLALLGAHPSALSSASIGLPEATAARAVRDLLGDAGWVRWASLNDLIPLLAEAAPSVFLSVVEGTLEKDPCPFSDVFAQEGGSFMGRNYITGLLWGLETLAWDPNWLTRSVMCLGELARIDPGGQWANRPKNSLTAILLPWFPQTCASVEKRVSAVSTLISELPEVGWRLVLSLLPEGHGSSSGTRKPAWREIIPNDWVPRVTHGEYWKQISNYLGVALAAAGTDSGKVGELIGFFDRLPSSERNRIKDRISAPEIIALEDEERLPLWTALLDLANRHRKYPDADWAMDSAGVQELSDLAGLIEPKSVALRNRHLFSERDFLLLEDTGDLDQQMRDLEAKRQQVLTSVIESEGLPAVIALTKAADSPWKVGYSLGALHNEDFDAEILPSLLESEQASLSQMAAGFIQGRLSELGWGWVDGVDRRAWSESEVGQFFSFLPFCDETWRRVEESMGRAEAEYWQRTTANPYQAQSNITHAVSKLIEFHRADAAIRCVDKMVRDGEPLDPGLASESLLAALRSPETAQRIDNYDAVEVIKALQSDPSTPPDTLFQVEWAYLPLLEGPGDATPRFLEKRLASDAAFFCEAIRIVFRSTKDANERAEEVETDQGIERNAYRLLHRWRRLPGMTDEGQLDEETFSAWLKEVEETCAASGHLEVAMNVVGNLFAHSPPDPNGLWVHQAVARVLNKRDASEMRSGFRTELFNARGVHWVDPSGNAERALAAEYRDKAEALEAEGFHRLGATVRELAETYEKDAGRVARREHFE